MRNALQETGWSKDTHKLPAATMEELVRKKNEFLRISFAEVEKAFHVSLDKFDDKKIGYIELAKGITRSLLRYDDCSFLLAQHVWKELQSTYGLANEIKNLALPYPIIHLPEDHSEIGPKHKDGYPYIDHFYTTWTPLNDCFHQPLSITEKTHRKNGFVLRQLRSRIKFIDRAILSTKKTLYPDIRLGEFFVWHGTTDHEGLLNKSGSTTTSIVLRFTSSPILYDVALPCADLEKFIPENRKTDTTELAKKIISFFNAVDAHGKRNDDEKKPFGELSAEIESEIKKWDLSPKEKKQFSFVLALWAQRMDGKRNVSLFYLYSYFIARDNFYVFHKCITSVLHNYGKDATEKFINDTIASDFSTQMDYVIKSAVNLNREKLEGIKLNIPAEMELLKYRFE
ncbi:MAG TPA: hypothetical protein VFJ43_12110 [Bacteroidia bacterium]|nr:hypothetical protein [Bacteroidia bacterium]